MVYYTFSQGFRPGAVQPHRTAPRSRSAVDPATGLPTVGPVDEPDARQAVQQALHLPARLADQQRDRLEDGVAGPPAAGQRLGVQHGLEERADADLQPARLWQHDVRRGRARLSDQGRRAADRRARHRRLDPAGLDVAQQRHGDQLAVHQVVEPRQPDADRQLHHAGVVAGAESECAAAKSARRCRCNAGLLADHRVQPARALRLATQRLQDVLRRSARSTSATCRTSRAASSPARESPCRPRPGCATTMPAYTTYDASFGVAKDQWSVQAYGKNLGDSSASLFTSSAQFIKSEVPLRPRVLGIKVGIQVLTVGRHRRARRQPVRAVAVD